jgi:xanthine dehydrogenase accessory factor
MRLQKGIKVGDIDPRMDVSMCYTISDKALLIGKGVLTALESIFAGSTND